MTTDVGCETCRWVVTSAVAGWPSWMPRLAFRPVAQGARGDVLLVVFLRGAADCLNVVVPHGEEAYYRLRPSASLPPRLPAWRPAHWAIVHACGPPDESRSPFQAMELMERGLTDLHGPASGWISRHLASFDTGNASPLRAVGIGEQLQRR